SDLTDLYFLENSKLPKFKTHKKTGVVTAKTAESYSNYGPANLTSGLISHFYSAEPYLELGDSMPIFIQSLTPIPANVPGKKPKRGKVKAKFPIPSNTGYIFTVIMPDNYSMDPDYSMNVIRR